MVLSPHLCSALLNAFHQLELVLVQTSIGEELGSGQIFLYLFALRPPWMVGMVEFAGANPSSAFRGIPVGLETIFDLSAKRRSLRSPGWICSIDMGKAVYLDNVYVVPPHADARACALAGSLAIREWRRCREQSPACKFEVHG